MKNDSEMNAFCGYRIGKLFSMLAFALIASLTLTYTATGKGDVISGVVDSISNEAVTIEDQQFYFSENAKISNNIGYSIKLSQVGPNDQVDCELNSDGLISVLVLQQDGSTTQEEESNNEDEKESGSGEIRLNEDGVWTN